MNGPFIDNKYTTIYYSLVKKAKLREMVIGLEKHHIIPESFYIDRTRKGPIGWLQGNPDDSNNLVYLTPREHFLAHRLLVRITTGIAKKKMSYALWYMLNGIKYETSIKKITSAEYESLRNQHTSRLKSDEFRNKFIGNKNPMNNPTHRKTWEMVVKSEDYKNNHINAVTSTKHRKNVSVQTKRAMARKDVIEKLKASLANPITKALKSSNVSGHKNPMFDHRVFLCVNEKIERIEIGTLNQLAKKLNLADIRSLKKTIKTGKETRYGWKII